MRKIFLFVFLVVLSIALPVLALTSENASKIIGFAVLNSNFEQSSKIVGFVVLNAAVEADSKTIGFVVLCTPPGTLSCPAPGGTGNLLLLGVGN